jgi:RAB protein geranylgeranyltransferase component A
MMAGIGFICNVAFKEVKTREQSNDTHADMFGDEEEGLKGGPESYETADDLQDFDKFFTSASKSSLKKNLTKKIWNQYKDESDA